MAAISARGISSFIRSPWELPGSTPELRKDMTRILPVMVLQLEYFKWQKPMKKEMASSITKIHIATYSCKFGQHLVTAPLEQNDPSSRLTEFQPCPIMSVTGYPLHNSQLIACAHSYRDGYHGASEITGSAHRCFIPIHPPDCCTSAKKDPRRT